MEEFPTYLPVVAAILRDANRRMLLQKRPAGKHHAGLWEFPGGKVESGEIAPFALVRELREELAIDVMPADLRPVATAIAPATEGQRATVLFLYTAMQWQGHLQAMEGNEWAWFTATSAQVLADAKLMPPADIELLETILRTSG